MGKWTKESKELAISLLKQGEGIKSVAAAVEMSEGSVSSLYYSKIKINEERIKCEICGEEFKQIRDKHLSNHQTNLVAYKVNYPNSPTCTESRKKDYKNFKSKNKGRTFTEIYGEEEGKKKRNKISKNQIGRACPKMAGTGITGTRRDTGTYARSTYEANVDRIFKLRNMRYIDELDERNERFKLQDANATYSYQPDRIDVDGLFSKGAYLEVKGYMFPKDWKKICLFRKLYPKKTLLVICPDDNYSDIDYKSLREQYKGEIPLWEEGLQNYKRRPDLYKIGYIEPKRVKFLKDHYPSQINKNIEDSHKILIAKKCIGYNKTSLGKKVYVDSIKLIAIANKRSLLSKISTGMFNYEMWEVTTECGKNFYVTNQSKTNVFYCYGECDKDRKMEMFEKNCNNSLSFGAKEK